MRTTRFVVAWKEAPAGLQEALAGKNCGSPHCMAYKQDTPADRVKAQFEVRLPKQTMKAALEPGISWIWSPKTIYQIVQTRQGKVVVVLQLCIRRE